MVWWNWAVVWFLRWRLDCVDFGWQLGSDSWNVIERERKKGRDRKGFYIRNRKKESIWSPRHVLSNQRMLTTSRVGTCQPKHSTISTLPNKNPKHFPTSYRTRPLKSIKKCSGNTLPNPPQCYGINTNIESVHAHATHVHVLSYILYCMCSSPTCSKVVFSTTSSEDIVARRVISRT
jgi:hypothetical protein